MPTIKSKLTGEKIADLPYSAQGEQTAQQMVQQDPNLEIDYSPGGQQDAPGMRESYHLGGEVPGQPGFGQKPGIGSQIPQQPMVPQPPASNNPAATGGVYQDADFPYGIWEKGGKVKYKK